MHFLRLPSRLKFRLTCLAGLFAAALPVEAAKILMVTGNSNGTVGKGELSKGDAFVQARLQTTLHHTVQILQDTTSQATLLAAAQASDLVLVVESVTSTLLKAKLKTMATPLLNYEAFIQDDMGMTDVGPSGDPGGPDKFAFGVLLDHTQLKIHDASHALAAGLQGTVTVYKAAKSITWGKVAATTKVIATLPEDSTGAVIYYYAKGNTLFDGTTAAGLRIGFFLEDDNTTGTPNYMTESGLLLFDAAVAFGLGTNATSITTPKAHLTQSPKGIDHASQVLQITGHAFPLATSRAGTGRALDGRAFAPRSLAHP